VQGRSERLRHHLAAQWCVTAVVPHLVHRRMEVEGEIHTRDDENHEAVETDLPEQERPVVRKSPSGLFSDEAGDAQSSVCPIGHLFTRAHVAAARHRSLGQGCAR
jgi:hypothetical protein